MENQSGLIVDAMLTPASGTAEREAALGMLGRQTGRHRAAPTRAMTPRTLPPLSAP